MLLRYLKTLAPEDRRQHKHGRRRLINIQATGYAHIQQLRWPWNCIGILSHATDTAVLWPWPDHFIALWQALDLWAFFVLASYPTSRD